MAVPAAADDPDVWAANTACVAIQDELIRRAPHNNGANPPILTDNCRNDNIKVHEIISNSCRNENCWTHVKKACKCCPDGRAAFLALKEHCLGSDVVDTEADRAEHILTNLHFSGNARRWTFEKHVLKHVKQHAILEELKEHHGFAGLDERSKVCHLLTGMKTSDLKLPLFTLTPTQHSPTTLMLVLISLRQLLSANKATNQCGKPTSTLLPDDANNTSSNTAAATMLAFRLSRFSNNDIKSTEK